MYDLRQWACESAKISGLPGPGKVGGISEWSASLVSRGNVGAHRKELQGMINADYLEGSCQIESRLSLTRTVELHMPDCMPDCSE